MEHFYLSFFYFISLFYVLLTCQKWIGVWSRKIYRLDLGGNWFLSTAALCERMEKNVCAHLSVWLIHVLFVFCCLSGLAVSLHKFDGESNTGRPLLRHFFLIIRLVRYTHRPSCGCEFQIFKLHLRKGSLSRLECDSTDQCLKGKTGKGFEIIVFFF